jgi:hypothetical protein
MKDGLRSQTVILHRPEGLRGPGGDTMAMDLWYDLRLREIFELRGRMHELLDDAEGLDAEPAPGRRVREMIDLADRAPDLPKEVTDNS